MKNTENQDQKQLSRRARKGRRENQDQDQKRNANVFIEHRHYEEQQRRGNLLKDGFDLAPTMSLYYFKNSDSNCSAFYDDLYQDIITLPKLNF